MKDEGWMDEGWMKDGWMKDGWMDAPADLQSAGNILTNGLQIHWSEGTVRARVPFERWFHLSEGSIGARVPLERAERNTRLCRY